MITHAELKQTLSGLGVRAGMRLIVHSAFSSFHDEVEGGPEGFCRALMEILTPEGTLLMPTFTFKVYSGKVKPFDHLNTPSDTGIVTEVFRKMPGVYRSADPCHSTAAWGKDAWWYVKDHHKVPTVSAECPIGRLEQRGGYVMTVSCENAVTFMHIVEQTNHVPCLGDRTEEYPGLLADGREVRLRTWGWRDGTCPALDTPAIFDAMRAAGEISETGLREARLSLFPCSAYRKAYEARLSAHCPQCTIRPRVKPATVPSDWDREHECLLPSDAFTDELPGGPVLVEMGPAGGQSQTGALQ